MIPRPAPYLDIVLLPYRSLSRRQFTIFMAALGLFSLAIGLGFVANGAWPVIGFFGLDVLVVYLALKASFRSGRWRERVALDDERLEVTRRAPGGRTERWEFNPGWVKVRLDGEPERSRLSLSGGGRSVVLGGFLPPAERPEVAREIRSGLARWRLAAP